MPSLFSETGTGTRAARPNPKKQCLIFESWYELLTYAERPITEENYHPRSADPEEKYGGSGWFGTEDFPDAQRVSIEGDPADLARVQAMAEGLEGSFTSGARDTSGMVMLWDYSGEIVDMDRYLTGDPENMVSFIPDDKLAKGKIISMVIDVYYDAGTPQETIRRRGAAVVALIDLIEKTGRRCELFITCGMTSGSSVEFSTKCCIKRADEGLDMTRLCYCLINPSMLRRHIFRLQETMPHNWIGAGYGRRWDEGMRRLAAGADLYISSSEAETIGQSDQSARRWLETELKRITEAEG